MVSLFNIKFSNLTLKETIEIIDSNIRNNIKTIYMDINTDKIVYAYENNYMFDIINSCDIVNPDGMAVFWASKFLGKPLKERIAGVDLFVELIKVSAEKGYRIYFLGAKQEVLEKMIKNIKEKFNNEIIAGYRNGYFEENEEERIVEMINDSGAEILFIGITSPKKELFIERNRDKLNVNFIMGVGGSFDVLAGHIKRAPIWVQKIGMKWLYRVYQEPRRLWKRYAVSNIKFIKIFLLELLKNKKK
ncbi:MAG TPA: WecB/TagA/CpsF family glycosyltransferase [Bacteroidales bacterium]|nr:WecB/TagA/CpsF family glycosyltransferase [Bacteroidales bacterium]